MKRVDKTTQPQTLVPNHKQGGTSQSAEPRSERVESELTEYEELFLN